MGSNDPAVLVSVGSWWDLWADLEDSHKPLALDDLLNALKSRDWDDIARSIWGRLAKVVHFREQTLRAMDTEKLRARLLQHLKTAMTNSAWSLLFYLYWRKHHGDLMRCFLDGLGIEHDGHGTYVGEIVPPAQAKLEAAVADVSKRFSQDDLRRYMRVLLVEEPKTWGFLITAYQDLLDPEGGDDAQPAGAAAAPTVFLDAPANELPSDEFTTLDRVLIRSIVDTVSDSEGALDADELDDLIATVIGLNSSRYRSYFHLGYMDTMVSGRTLNFEHPEFNDLRREWYLCGALTGLLRRREAETIKTIFTSRSDDFRRASGRPGGPGAAMARTLTLGLIEMGRVTEAALLIRGQASEAGGLTTLSTVLRKASDLLRDSDLTSAGTLLNALDQAQYRLDAEEPLTQSFRRQLTRRLGQYHQAQGNFKQATTLFERLEKTADPDEAFEIVTDLGLVRAGFKSLVEVKLPVDKEQRASLLGALRRGASQFERAVKEAPGTATNAHYALAVLKYLERSQSKSGDSSTELGEQALRHAQEALDGMRLADAAPAYERLGLTGQCLFIQAVLQMQRLDPVDARAASAAWDQITAEAGTFPIDDIRELIEAADIIDPSVAAQIAESVWRFRPNGATELVQFDSVIRRSQFMQERLLETARQSGQSRPQQWDLWTKLVPTLLRVGNAEAAEEGLDALQQLAESESFAKRFVDYLSDSQNYDPVWDETDVKWARLRVARRLGDDQLSGTLLRSIFFEVRDSDPSQAKQILELCADWKIDAIYHNDLAASMPIVRPELAPPGLDDRLKRGEAVRVLFVGGNEIQAQYDRDISDTMRREWPGVSITFRHTGWSSNWGRELDGLKRDASMSDCVVLMTMMRTMLGRKLRAGLDKPWLTCAATGRSGILNSIRDAVRVGLQARASAARA